MSVPFVPLNWRQTADELAWQLRDASITVLVVDEERAAVAKIGLRRLAGHDRADRGAGTPGSA